jgi:hypothetical protein
MDVHFIAATSSDCAQDARNSAYKAFAKERREKFEDPGDNGR